MRSERKILYTAFLISIVAHTAILLQSLNLVFFAKHDKNPKVEVNYVRSEKTEQVALAKMEFKKEPIAQLPPKVSFDKSVSDSLQQIQEMLKKKTESNKQVSPFLKPAIAKPDTISIRKKITLPSTPLLDSDKINNPSYISYYQLVREKIRRSAYHNYLRTETGAIYLSFVVLKDGSLQDVQLQQDKSSDNPYLAQVSMKSIKDASPFPSFPQELNYPQLSFNVIISFETE